MGYLLLRIIDYLLAAMELIIFVEAILSWFISRESSVMSTLNRITEPLLGPCYRLQERLVPNSPVDFSPVIAILLLQLIRRII